jgi:GNAT superfamily N-acetyltransferase
MVMDVRVAGVRDLTVLAELDTHVDQQELRRVVEAGRVTVGVAEGSVRGWLRWGLFWDEIPFLNMLFVVEQHRGQGLGTRLIRHWEDQRRAAGHRSVMTSTSATERAQHLYRRLGYRERGCLTLLAEPLEIIFVKSLGPAVE